jgi:antibiotic biosynthesis monooxygenase (ABM) superfamily enzyme
MARLKNNSNEPVTVVFSWTIKQGKEQLFEHMMHDVHKVARTFPGHMGVTILNSPQHKPHFQVVLRFDNAQHLEGWLHSSVRHEMMKHIEKIGHTDASVKATGLETWFKVPSQAVTPPSRWKMVVTTFTAIYPLSLLYGIFLAPAVAEWPTWIRSLFLPVFAPIILTYLFMPFLTQRVLKQWLYKKIQP